MIAQTRLAVLPVAIALLAACAGNGSQEGSGPAEPPPADIEATLAAGELDALDRARAAADALGGVLMKRLLETLEVEGPAAAVRVCSEVAQQLAAEQESDDLRVRRVTLKERNPADRPDPFERERLERLALQSAKGELPREIVELTDDDGARVLRYMRPIVVMQPCLQCHGEPGAMAPDVLAVIDERYPEDRARGYRDGDLRGAVSVVVDLP
jgi:hypothetical protein